MSQQQADALMCESTVALCGTDDKCATTAARRPQRYAATVPAASTNGPEVGTKAAQPAVLRSSCAARQRPAPATEAASQMAAPPTEALHLEEVLLQSWETLWMVPPMQRTSWGPSPACRRPAWALAEAASGDRCDVRAFGVSCADGSVDYVADFI